MGSVMKKVEIAVVGGGPAGMAAAIEASRAGAQVTDVPYIPLQILAEQARHNNGNPYQYINPRTLSSSVK